MHKVIERIRAYLEAKHLLLAGTRGGLLLAFALGAQDFVRDLIAAHQLHRLYKVGQRIRFGDYEGVVIAITTVTLVLEVPEGRLAVPARRLLAEPVILLSD